MLISATQELPPPNLVARRLDRSGSTIIVTIDLNALLRTPAYSLSEAAHYRRLPVRALRSWRFGQTYQFRGWQRRFQPRIWLDGQRLEGLFFLNLVEAHVLAAMRCRWEIPVPKVHAARDFVGKRLKVDRPLTTATFETNDIELFVTVPRTLHA
jgi:hypothetical protein